MRCRTLSRALVSALALAVSLAGAARAADRLGSLPVDPAQISVSGISSGAFMANQLHVAHSASLMGAGLVAGGLYGCAVFDATEVGVQPMTSLALGPCMTAPSLLQPAATYADRMRQFAALGWIVNGGVKPGQRGGVKPGQCWCSGVGPGQAPIGAWPGLWPLRREASTRAGSRRCPG